MTQQEAPTPLTDGNGAGRRPLITGRRSSTPDRRRPVPGAPAGRRQLPVQQWVRLGWLALVLVVLGAATGLLAAGLMPEKYTARADVLYAVTREQPTGFLREDRNISTQLVLLQSRAVLGPVADEWGVSVEQLRAAVSASVVEESEIISVELTDGDPDRAEEVLASVLDRYLDTSPNEARSDVGTYVRQQLADIALRLLALPVDAPDRASLVAREQALRTQLDDLQLTDLAGPAAEVLTPPFADRDPVSPRPALTAAAGATAGLVVAALLVAVLARRMTRPDGSRA